MSAIVPPSGPLNSRVLVIGKAPGREEVSAGIPFIGRAGKEHRSYCTRHSLSPYSFRTTNLCRVFIPPDERLTPQQISEWTPDLLAEIDRVRPSLIIPIGSDPVRWFLGKGADLKTVHGIPHRPGEFDPLLSYRAPEGCCILPLIQPAAGFHSSDTRALIDWDYSQVRRVLSLIEQGREGEIDYRSDPYAGLEEFYDVTGGELADILLSAYPSVIGLDTEGTVSDPFCLQVCFSPPTAYMLRIDQADFLEGIEALRILAAAGTIFTGHNLGMYDLEMCRRAFHLDLFDAQCHDTLFDAYLFCIEPLGLKPNSWRHLGMRMKSHSETVGALGVEFQLDYLQRVIDHTRHWPKPDPIFELQNDGQMKVTWKPLPISTRVQAVFTAIEKGGEVGEDGEGDGLGSDEPETGDSLSSQINGVDPRKRWAMIRKDLPDLVKRVESEIGRMPHATMRRLYERDPESAIRYSCTDALGHYRLYFPFIERLEREGKTRLADEYSINMHVYSEMQENKLPALRSRLVAVRDRMTEKMLEIVEDISTLYNDGVPFNPKSSPQKGKLLEKWGLKGTKLTKAKKVSYGKKSIEHYRFITENMTDEEKFRRELVVKLLFWGEHQHTRDMFCTPALARISEDQEECWIGGQIMPWGTQSRRPAMKNLNLLAQPKHSPFGKAIRECYVAPEGYLFLESDLRTIEVCVMADESADPGLCSLLQTDVDFHRETAARYFEIPKNEVTGNQRTFAKRIIFGTFFGQTGQGLREQLWMQGLIHFTDEICQEGIDGVKYRVYPGIGRYEKKVEGWLRGTPRNPNTNGSIRTRSGMERLLPGIHSEDKATQREAVRHGVSQKIQGGAQDLIQTSMSWLKDEVRRLRTDMGIDVRWLLTVYDSLLLLVPEWAVDIVREVVEEGLTQHCGATLRVPVRAESKTARTWGEL